MSDVFDDLSVDDKYLLLRVPWVVAERAAVDHSGEPPLLTEFDRVTRGQFKKGGLCLPLFTERDYAENFLRSQSHGLKPPREMAVSTFAGWEEFLAFLHFWQFAVTWCALDLMNPKLKQVKPISVAHLMRRAAKNCNALA
jgi:hypothetical protein